MKLSPLFIAIFLFTSCSTRILLEEIEGPSTQKIIADLQPVADPTDLKQLIKSLPVWENREFGFVDGWIDRMGKQKGQTLAIMGDGAQNQLALTKLPARGKFNLVVGNEEYPEEGHFVYHLKRLDKGWQVLPKSSETSLADLGF